MVSDVQHGIVVGDDAITGEVAAVQGVYHLALSVECEGATEIIYELLREDGTSRVGDEGAAQNGLMLAAVTLSHNITQLYIAAIFDDGTHVEKMYDITGLEIVQVGEGGDEPNPR